MSLSKPTPTRTGPDIEPEDRCPCLSGSVFGECCGPLLAAERNASTAEQLMRSRFTAFATGDASYLLRTWHKSTRPKALVLDPDQRWYRLDVLWAERGGVLDADGQVSFRAYYRHPDGAGEQREVSRFVRENGEWSYVNAD